VTDLEHNKVHYVLFCSSIYYGEHEYIYISKIYISVNIVIALVMVL